jgi:V8-like Glu-specific endopeptidase
MAVQGVYIEEAKKALQDAITEMEEMSSKFTRLNTDVDANINAESGVSMAGQVGSVAANVWSEDNVEVFNQLIAETRDFNENKLNDMLVNYQGYTEDAYSTYKA